MKISLKRRILLILEALLFAFVSWVFFTFISSVFNAVGSALDVKPTMLPYWLSVIILIYFLFVYHLILFPKTEKKLLLTYKINGIVLASLSLVAAVLIVIWAAKGTYAGIVAGVVTPLFPLDFLLSDIIICGLGIYFAFFLARKKPTEETRYYPYAYGKVRLVFSSILRGLYALFALYFTASFIISIFIAKYSEPSGWELLFIWFLMGVPGALLAYHDWFYMDEIHTREGDLKRSLIALIVSASLVILMLIGILTVPNFIVENATGIFMLDYMKSWNAAPYLMGLSALVPPTAALIFTLFSKKESPEEDADLKTEEMK
jgi:hypothetical protein